MTREGRVMGPARGWKSIAPFWSRVWTVAVLGPSALICGSILVTCADLSLRLRCPASSSFEHRPVSEQDDNRLHVEGRMRSHGHPKHVLGCEKANVGMQRGGEGSRDEVWLGVG
ncbi:hypothetical protein BHM03_00034462 [Ensete ventricosum]|nr:hypothetical protein BHM03_00034462 [Ensete ventricosum]